MKRLYDLSCRHHVVIIIAIYLLISIYRLQEIPPPWSDEMAHINAAQHLAEEGVLRCDFYDVQDAKGRLFISMPMQWFLLGFFIKAFGASYFGMRFLYLILSCAILLMVHAIAKRLLDRRIALLSILFLASSYIFFNVSRQLLPQVPASFFSVLAILCFYAAREKESSFLFAVTGGFCAFSFLSHPLGIASFFAVILLFFHHRVKVKYFISYALAAFVPISAYAAYALSDVREYIRQSLFALDAYPHQLIFINVIDEVLVRYLGWEPFRTFFLTEHIDGKNAYVYYMKRFFENIDLRIYFCEIIGKLSYLVSVIYLLAGKARRKKYSDPILISVVYMSALALHPNKFGPYLYLAVPYLSICAAVLTGDLLGAGYSKRAYLKKAAGISILGIFLATNIMYTYRALASKRIYSYFKFIDKVSAHIPKRSVVAGAEYYWLGMHKDYVFIPAQVIVCEIDRELKARGGGTFFRKLPKSERFNMLKKYLARHKIEYVLVTWHNWERITAGNVYSEGIHETLTQHLFSDGSKVADFLKERYYTEMPDPKRYEEELYFPPRNSAGFDNVSVEYQDGLKIYKIAK